MALKKSNTNFRLGHSDRKNRTTFSDVSLLPEIFHRNDPKSCALFTFQPDFPEKFWKWWTTKWQTISSLHGLGRKGLNQWCKGVPPWWLKMNPSSNKPQQKCATTDGPSITRIDVRKFDWLQLGATVNLPNRIPYLASSSCRLNDSSLWSKSEQSVYENKYSDKNLMISSYLVVLQDNLFTTIHLLSAPWTFNKKSLSLILTSNTCTVTNAADMKTLLSL